MASTDIGTIFLDRQLLIHRFTPSAQKIFNLIPSRTAAARSPTSRAGSTTTDLSLNAESVLEILKTIEREVLVGATDAHGI